MPLVVPLVTTAWRTYLSSSLSVASVFGVADAVAQQLERKYCQPTPEFERTMRARQRTTTPAGLSAKAPASAAPIIDAPAPTAAHTPLARAKFDYARTARFAAIGAAAGACLVPVVATTRSFIPGLDSALAMLPIFGPIGVPGLFFAVLSLPPLGIISYNMNRREEYEFHVPPNIADFFTKYTLMSFGFWWTCGYLNCVCQIITDSLGAQTGVLPDFGFWLLPWLPLPWLPSVVVGTSAAFLVAAGATASRWPLGVLVRRFMAIHGFILFFRGISIISTVLPNPDITCVAYHPHVFPLAALLVSMGVNNTCGDVLFSGHGAALMLSAMAFRKYTDVPEGYKTAFDVFNGVSMLAIVATHYHYTIDVVVGAFLTWVAFHSYHHVLPHQGESSLATFLHWLQHSDNVDPSLLEEEHTLAKGAHNHNSGPSGSRQPTTTFDTFASLMCGSPVDSMSPTSPAILSKDARGFTPHPAAQVEELSDAE